MGFFLSNAYDNTFDRNEARDNASNSLIVTDGSTGNEFDRNDFCVVLP